MYVPDKFLDSHKFYSGRVIPILKGGGNLR